MKLTDLHKNRGLKIRGKMAAVPGGAAADPAHAVDRREQRRQERASGLVPFACKLPTELVKQIQERGAAHEGGVNALVAELIAKGLADPK